ncbi:MAG: hypothetical protein CENE_02805 [Candidatus Celerinatantimonas neptuna]|nr:MAG: hypothetical protein CENE_02805 [Candidatus Celerinatantimonas neptuna]
MIKVTDSAQAYLQSLVSQTPGGLRMVGIGNLCQGIQVQVSWQDYSSPDDREEWIGELPVWIAASLCRQVMALLLDIESSEQGPVLLITPEYPDCDCSSQDCQWHQLGVAMTE